MDFSILNLCNADVDAADEVLKSAFGGVESRKKELERFLTFQPDGWRAGVVADRLAGMVGAVDYGPFAWLGFMAISSALQRQGLGLALMQSILSWLDQRGCPIVRLDATAAGEGLYRKLGFYNYSHTMTFSRSPGDSPVLRSGRVVRLLTLSNLPEIAALDETVFGVNRFRFLYSYLSDLTGRAFMAQDENGQPEGFLFASPQKIGPWMAHSLPAAEALLKEALQLPYDGTIKVIVPRENTDAHVLLQKAGFQAGGVHRHMVRGAGSLPGRRELYYGQLSFVLG